MANSPLPLLISLLGQGAVDDVTIDVGLSSILECHIDGRKCQMRGWDCDVAAGVMRALSTSPSLRNLRITGSIRKLVVGSRAEELSELFHGIASNSCPSLTHFTFWLVEHVEPQAAAATTLSQALQHNRSIESLMIVVSDMMYNEVDGAHDGFLSPWAGLLSSLRNPDCSIRRLEMRIIPSPPDAVRLAMERDLSALAKALLAENQSIKDLDLQSYPPRCKLPEEAAGLLERNSTLTTLSIDTFDLRAVGGFDRIFHSLASNISLTHLSLIDCKGPFTLASILDSLQANGRISQLDLRSTPLEGIAALEAQLERNRKNAERMDALHRSSSKVRPTRCRLFLCGNPYAGRV